MSLIFSLWRMYEVLLSNPKCGNIKSIYTTKSDSNHLGVFVCDTILIFTRNLPHLSSFSNDLKMRSVLLHLLNLTVWVNLQYLSRAVPDTTGCRYVRWDSLDIGLCTVQGKNCSSFALILNSLMLCKFSIKFELRLNYIKRTKWKKRILCSLIHFKEQLYI